MTKPALLLLCFALLKFQTSDAAVIHVTTNDSYAKIEAAQPGDEVVIAPGTYRFRVHLKKKATAEKPIVIHAEDSANKPVWDFSNGLVENAPGSHTAGDRGRGGWQIQGGEHYIISGIVFANCHTAEFISAGLRYYGGTKGIVLRDCVFRDNDNGLTGGTQDSDITVECCEFAHNGNLAALHSGPTHNLYIFGGTFTMRFCHVHDSVQAENFHIRARNATLEYNWFARAKSYEGDLMTDNDFRGPGRFSQTMLVRGNVFVQNENPENRGQVLVVFNDSRAANDTMTLQVINNTYVGNGRRGQGGSAAFVHLANRDGTPMRAEIFNNIISGTTIPVLVDNTKRAQVAGGNNWLASGVNPGPLTNCVFSVSPGFKGPTDFTLAPGSAAIGHADPTLPDLPKHEYGNGDETVICGKRLRMSARDIGAFESSSK